jgi:two-component system, cell cycle response regulator DivK
MAVLMPFLIIKVSQLLRKNELQAQFEPRNTHAQSISCLLWRACYNLKRLHQPSEGYLHLFMEKVRILVVEDNPDNRILITDILTSLGYEVSIAVDGEEGVEKARAEKPNLILMDLSLPQKDGWTATREIRQIPELAGVKIIALTAHAMVGDRERALEAGCDDYVSKPIDLRELTERLAEHLA